MKNLGTTPKHLKGKAGELWQRLRADFEINDAGGLALLQAACESFQRVQEARALLDKEGLIVSDRFGQRKAHPATNIERDARAQLISALRALKLAPEDI